MIPELNLLVLKQIKDQPSIYWLIKNPSWSTDISDPHNYIVVMQEIIKVIQEFMITYPLLILILLLLNLLSLTSLIPI